MNDKIIIPRNKEQIDEAYGSILADFATKTPKENSRVHIDKKQDYENRSDFQRDRDRIIHSKAFRRLMYKTQVFVNHEGDHFRTRLTHTLEVAQISRGICKSLALNEDLAEAIALGHDLGHTPFGHAVERFLNEELKKREMIGFSHNEQSVRVVDLLENRCKDYLGLNLTFEVREGILKHNKDRTGIYSSLDNNKICSTLEGQVVGLVDTVTYVCHDLQDGIVSGLVENAMERNDDFKNNIEEIEKIAREMLKEKVKDKLDFSRFSDTYFIDDLIHHFVMSITDQSAINIIDNNINSLEDVKNMVMNGKPIIDLKKEDEKNFKKFKDLMKQSVYGINTIEIMDSKAITVASDLFNSFVNNPNLLPSEELYKYLHFEEKYKSTKEYDGYKTNEIRVICDYIAGMTDRFALEEHDRITNPRIKI